MKPVQIEKLHCEPCGQNFYIPVEDFHESEQMCCPYCKGTKDIFDVETVTIVGESA